MKLFLITRPEYCGYDEYDSAVVAAEDEATAKKIHPSGGLNLCDEDGTWTKPVNVQVKYLGEAASDIEANSVICASFNAG